MFEVDSFWIQDCFVLQIEKFLEILVDWKVLTSLTKNLVIRMTSIAYELFMLLDHLL